MFVSKENYSWNTESFFHLNSEEKRNYLFAGKNGKTFPRNERSRERNAERNLPAETENAYRFTCPNDYGFIRRASFSSSSLSTPKEKALVLLFILRFSVYVTCLILFYFIFWSRKKNVCRKYRPIWKPFF